MQQEYPETKQWAGHNTYDEMKLRVSSAGPRPVSKASSKPSTSYVRTMEQRLNELQREVSQVKQVRPRPPCSTAMMHCASCTGITDVSSC